MNYVEVVRAATHELKLVNPAGKLLALDSMAMVKLAVAIEDATGIAIPPSRVVPKDFKTIESIAKLLEELSPSR
jgi:acyl carrier protein